MHKGVFKGNSLPNVFFSLLIKAANTCNADRALTPPRCSDYAARERSGEGNLIGMLLEFPGINPPPSSPPPLSSITVRKSIRSFNVQHNGQGELFCDHNARKRYLSAKKVRTIEAPGPGNNQWGSWGRCPPPVKISYCNIAEGRAGCVTVDSSRAGGPLSHLKKKKSQKCLIPQISKWHTALCIQTKNWPLRDSALNFL